MLPPGVGSTTGALRERALLLPGTGGVCLGKLEPPPPGLGAFRLGFTETRSAKPFLTQSQPQSKHTCTETVIQLSLELKCLFLLHSQSSQAPGPHLRDPTPLGEQSLRNTPEHESQRGTVPSTPQRRSAGRRGGRGRSTVLRAPFSLSCVCDNYS